MRAISPIHIGPAQDMAPGMGSDMATDRAIGEIRSDTMGPPTDPLVWGGIVDMVGLAERNGHRVRQGRVLCRHLMLRRSSEKSTEIPLLKPVPFGSFFSCLGPFYRGEVASCAREYISARLTHSLRL